MSPVIPRRSVERESEGEIQAAIRLAVGSLPDVRLWRNNTGALRDARGRQVRYGLAVGSADLIGVVGPHGRFVAIEVKSAGGSVTGDQSLWLETVRRMGGVAGVARSVEEALALIEEARR